jgi:hypothetical protein
MVDARDKARMRNFVQYRDMTDEEYDKAFEELLERDFEEELLQQGEEFDSKVDKKLKEFDQDYDLSDMKYNDHESLRVLCKALVTLETLDNISVQLLTSGLGDLNKNLTLLDKISSISSNLRRDISKLQDDLKITRKSRKIAGVEDSRTELARLKLAAKEMYEKVHSYIYCEKCNMLLGTVWFSYPYINNSVSLTCNRTYYNNEGVITGQCNHITEVTSEQLMEKRGTNHPEGFIY